MTQKSVKDVIIITGPTASGKSALAIDIAREFNGRIINADSMQIYSDLRIVTARPSAADEKIVPHSLYGILDGVQICSANIWRNMAIDAIETTFDDGLLPIICGGTGMYLKTLTEGMSYIPDINKDIRADIRSRLDEVGSLAVYDELAKIDPTMAARLNPADKQRVARALEVVMSTGRSLAKWQQDKPIAPPEYLKFHIITIAPPRDILYDRCNKRFAKMLQYGALEEVKKLMQRNIKSSLPIMRALGVAPIISYLNNEISLKDAEIKACAMTRQYAKRQMTWINNNIISKKHINSQYSEKIIHEIFPFICENILTKQL